MANATEEYMEALSALWKKENRLRSAIARHEADQLNKPKNWAVIGDLKRVSQDIENILSYLEHPYKGDIPEDQR